MITEENILECLDDVDVDLIIEYLFDSNEMRNFVFSIADNSSEILIDSMVSILKAMADAKRYNLAADLAEERELSSMCGLK